MAVPPNFVDFAKEAGLAAYAYGPELQVFWDEEFLRGFWPNLLRSLWTIREPIRLVRELWEPCLRAWREMSETLASLAEGADLLCSGLLYQDLAISVAEANDIPFATLHYFPIRPNGQLFDRVPPSLLRSAMTVHDWFCWRMNKSAENAQRRELGLPAAKRFAARRIVERGSLEIQAYDKAFFPDLEAEWGRWGPRRPFVGSLTMGLTTEDDDEVASWIASGKPPICFALGTIAAESPATTLEMIGVACAQLGERALVCTGGRDFTSGAPQFEHVKVIGMANYGRIFPACRAVVHHGGSGTTHAGLRAGVPSLIWWTSGDQPFWAAAVRRLKVGTARRFAATTSESLVQDLRRILAPEYAARARDFASRMTEPTKSVARAADLVEEFARVKRLV
ncbi:glycosyl transferase family 1 [Mycobacterium sp. 852002-30065_SCH5024008]|nr:glycosyl transferase family 1 [Mycobacterium sp. 852002-30065_SCH5024008]